LLIFCLALPWWAGAAEPDTIRVGLLHSSTGSMALSEKPLIDAARLAIEEVNAAGGVLGKKLVAIEADGASDPQVFAREAERLITREKVVTIFGCWTSASRKAVLPVLERHSHLLWYPVQYEGFESSPHVIYTGAAPNQQILPAVEWCLRHRGKRMFLVGSDYIFPRTANEIIRQRLKKLGGQTVGEVYRPLGDRDWKQVVDQIVAARPDVVLNTINGDSNLAFFRELKSRALAPGKPTVMSFSLAEVELQSMGEALPVGHLCAWNYFQSLTYRSNRRFVETYRRHFGANRVTDDPVEAAYFGVHLYALAVRKAGSTVIERVRKAAGGLIFEAPSGLVRIDPENQHTWKVARIGQILPDGQFQILWTSEQPIRPEPYPDLNRGGFLE
jgi:urea transport system substrate-binding protein